MRSKQLKPSSPEVRGCAALVLAAGRGRRFGSDKRLARLADGQELLAATLALVQRQFGEVWVVLAGHDDAEALGVPAGVRVVHAEQADSGMGASLAAGIAALQATSPAQAVAVLLGDMPWIADRTLARLQEAATAEAIVLPQCQGQRGHPVLFGRVFWGELSQVRGDQGGRAVLLAHPEACRVIAVPDAGISQDVDTPDDLIGR